MDEVKKGAGRSEQEAIKDAVGGGAEKEELFVPSPGSARMFGERENSGRNLEGMGYDGMQPSILGREQENNSKAMHQEYAQQEVQQEPAQNDNYPADYNQQYYDQGAGQEAAQQYPQQQYQSYQEVMSSDVITEISEQVVDEKLSVMRDKLERAIDFKTVAEAKINGVDKRLKRIEQIIDILQVSLIQKVSEYVTDVKDFKNELIETQKSFKSIAPHLKVHHAHSEHSHTQHHSPHHTPVHHSTHHAVHHHASHPHHAKKHKKHTP